MFCTTRCLNASCCNPRCPDDPAENFGANDADNGPEMCSGLPVQRNSAEQLTAAMGGEGFTVISTEHETHTTPSGGEQRFVGVTARRNCRQPVAEPGGWLNQPGSGGSPSSARQSDLDRATVSPVGVTSNQTPSSPRAMR